MAQIIFLGTAGAMPDETHQCTHLAVTRGARTVMVDASGNPIVRLKQAGIDPLSIDDLILTHFHPDHASGVPMLLMDLWLLGRKRPLRVHGLAHALDRLQQMMDLFESQRWPGFFAIEYHRLEESERVLVLDEPDLRILASPVKHLLPTIGLRFEFTSAGKSAAYSCDTEPSPAVVDLARSVDVLIHEATGEGVGHSSPEQAGEIASQAGAKALYLVHYHPASVGGEPEKLPRRAASMFAGPVTMAEDLMQISLD